MNSPLPPPVGFVSDERDVALADVLVEFATRRGTVAVARSTASGAIHVDLAPGRYRVTLAHPGFGSRWIDVELGHQPPYRFRLLSDRMQGYVWPKWVRGGETAEIRAHAAEEYRLQLWRYGWNKQPLAYLGVIDEHGPRATVQITPDGDYTQTGVHWNEVGYLGRARKPQVTAPERSGLYYIHATSASGSVVTFPWIVAPREPQAPLAVLASNITWNAYNNFGGRSNYIQAGGLRDRPTVNARQDLKRYTDPDHVFYDREDYPPLSFDRPEPMCHIDPDEAITDPIWGRNACHLAPAEWRLLGWLEQNGFDYDLYAETQLHFGDLPLDRYRTLLLSTHPEYWSRRMYDAVKQWVFDAGGRLVYLGGNGLNCEVEFLDEATMTVRNGIWTDADRQSWESRFHKRYESEANLLGVVFTESGIMTSAPYRVIDERHWSLEGTGLRNGDLFGRESLHRRCPGGASGHETDKISSQYSPPGTHLIAKGTNPDDGGAEMVHFTTPSGGEVFSVGSITWTSSIVVDEHVAQITANVLKRFLAG